MSPAGDSRNTFATIVLGMNVDVAQVPPETEARYIPFDCVPTKIVPFERIWVVVMPPPYGPVVCLQ
jgi:hypothetical protein